MKNALLALFLLLPHAAFASDITDGSSGGGDLTDATHSSGSTFTLDDDVQLELGDGIDYHFVYDSGNTRLELNSTDCDGGGTDCSIFYVVDGSNTLLFHDGSAANPSWAFAGDDDMGFYKAGSFIGIGIAGAARWLIGVTDLEANITNGPQLEGTNTSSTNATVQPDKANTSVGMGATPGSEILHFIVNDTAAITVDNGGGAQVLGMGLVPPKVTADPCGGSDYPEGSVFYNDTSNYHCFCNGAGDDIKSNDNTTACF